MWYVVGDSCQTILSKCCELADTIEDKHILGAPEKILRYVNGLHRIKWNTRKVPKKSRRNLMKASNFTVGHVRRISSKEVLYAADEGLRAETSCIQLLNNLLRITHKLFAYENFRVSLINKKST